MSAPQCLQALDNGRQCKAPAVDGSRFCRHHDPQSNLDEERQLKLRQKQPFSLPDFNDNPGVVIAVKAVLNALAERRIKRSEADTFMHGLKFVAKLMTEIQLAGGASLPIGPPRPEDDVWEPNLFDIDEFYDSMQNGTPDELISQIVAKQKAWLRQRSHSAQPQPIERFQSPERLQMMDRPQPGSVTRRPSDQAIARLAAAGNQKAIQFLAACGHSSSQKQSTEQNHSNGGGHLTKGDPKISQPEMLEIRPGIQPIPEIRPNPAH